jgi:hypothetical protein
MAVVCGANGGRVKDALQEHHRGRDGYPQGSQDGRRRRE